MITSFSGEFAFLSNFYHAGFWHDGVWVKTVEHGYQAAKAALGTQRDDILNADTPGKAKRLGRVAELRLGWEAEKVEVMLRLLRKKFENPVLGDLLLATGDRELVEGNHWGDSFWGVCRGVGQNVLGKLLMQVREEVHLARRDAAQPRV